MMNFNDFSKHDVCNLYKMSLIGKAKLKTKCCDKTEGIIATQKKEQVTLKKMNSESG